MDERIRIELEVDPADHEVLREIAEDRSISIHDVAAEAVQTRIAAERDWDVAVREGLADIEAGRTVSHEEYLAHAAERRRRWLAEQAG